MFASLQRQAVRSLRRHSCVLFVLPEVLSAKALERAPTESSPAIAETALASFSTLSLRARSHPSLSCRSEQHLKDFLDKYVELKGSGAELVACVSVNDPQ